MCIYFSLLLVHMGTAFTCACFQPSQLAVGMLQIHADSLSLSPSLRRARTRTHRPCTCSHKWALTLNSPPTHASNPECAPVCRTDCRNLRTLALTAANLQRLNVSNCLALASLALRTPALEALLASNCPSLASLMGLTEFPALRELNASCTTPSVGQGVLVGMPVGHRIGYVCVEGAGEGGPVCVVGTKCMI